MIPAFGFSVGDFIAAIGLCTKVAKTLKGSSGVSAEYQQVIIEIEGLQDALTRLARLEPTESNIDHVNAIRRMALACSLPMQDFLSKLERYEGSMSPFTTGKSIRSVGKKAEYAVFMSEEVKTMRTMISGKVISINLLLATHASETLSRTQDRLSTNQENLLSRLEEAKVGLSRIRQDIENMNTASCTSQERFEQETGAHLIQIGNDNASTKRSISALAIGVSSISTSITTLCRLGTQIQSILSTFPAELRDLLQTVVRTNMQMYTVLLEVHRKISAPPTLALDSNIRTEDALGVVRSLPYEWFRHWEVR
ncbi:hypothetical protein P280DRAFT_194530 [Massarina eburnea CBS 473.64]|uniref:Fungal N-terminal domain-containing protein n=1 Tax=Massarina eburnea CBS 473.64 TaxID=1395130 RepID=A0A6A6RMU0_9PLEO|nr:hypothetical protein P280DRAFT_194530 [Massarina eburnea CBS 473.64]